MTNPIHNKTRHYRASMDELPESWLDAELDSPSAADEVLRLDTRQRVAVMPDGVRVAPINVLLGTLLASFITGLAWYLIYRIGIYAGPWIAVPVGLGIAGCVRGAAGPGDAPLRAFSSLLGYLLTLLGVLMLTAWASATGIYSDLDFDTFEDFLIESRFGRIDALIAYVLGAFGAVKLSYLLRRR